MTRPHGPGYRQSAYILRYPDTLRMTRNEKRLLAELLKLSQEGLQTAHPRKTVLHHRALPNLLSNVTPNDKLDR